MFPGFALSHISYANPLHLICSLEMVEKTWNFLEKKNTSNIQSPFRQFFTPKLPLLSFFCPAQVGLSLSTYPKFTHMTAVFKCIRAVPGSVLGSILRDAVPGELLAWSCLLVKQKSMLGSRMGTLLETPSMLELDPLGKIKRQKAAAALITPCWTSPPLSQAAIIYPEALREELMRLLWNESSLAGCKCPSGHIKGAWILALRSFELCEHSEYTSKKPTKRERETKGRSVNDAVMHPRHWQALSLWEFCPAQLSSTETSPRQDFLELLWGGCSRARCSFTAEPSSSWGFPCVSLVLRIIPFLHGRVPQAPWRGFPSLRSLGSGAAPSLALSVHISVF